MSQSQITAGPKYIHNAGDGTDHTEAYPKTLVPIFMEMFQPKTVCDVGCGLGAFLSVFKKSGVQKVKGFDGEWADRQAVSQYLDDNEFGLIDLEGTYPSVSEKFDLVLNLEVAEHVSDKNSDNLVSFLTGLGDTIIFSAAIPGQGGYKHINEQWEEYWEEKFNKKGFKKYDIIRHKIFSNKEIIYWYRQNILVYSKKDLSHFPEVKLPNLISQELFTNKVNLVKQLTERLKGGVFMRAMRKLLNK
jgi:hypothetical protein